MLALTKRQNSSDAYRLLCGTCPDEECQAKLYFPSNEKSIECTNCGQRHDKSLLQNVAEVTGLSNYVCKLISPILTNYGMDRKLGRARLLKDMGKGEMFNCGRILGDRVFLIEEENLDVIGYGKDRSGSIHYLADTLNDIRIFNDNETRLIPIHVDGDGHCLVHAISRALVGRELFWHALRVNLGLHIRDNLASYKQLFKDFIDAEEWEDIIDECDPYYIPPEGEPIGLRNIHIFGLANVLHRPIILLDSKSGMQSPGDYSGVFVPGLVSPEDCRGKDGTLNKPLCIAWSSSGRNHYIPLVGIKGRAPAMLPAYMVQTAWGMPEESIKNYLELDNMDRCVVGGDKCLTDRYIRQLVAAMEEVFIEQNQVHPSLVADVHQFIYKSSGIVCVQPDEVIQRTQQSVRDEVLYRCLTCEALVGKYHLDRQLVYQLAINVHKKLNPDKLCSFPMQDAVCSCNAERECIPDIARSHPNTCAFCSGEMLRRVKADGGILYKDGDRTTTPCVGGKCSCGYKHFWQGKEYDNLPELFPISLQWAGKVVSEKVAWFQYETDPTMNRNVYEVAEGLVQKHFPGEFGSERLVQQVVDTILDQTASAAAVTDDTDGEGKIDNEDTASNIIITGPAQEEDGAVEDASDLLQGQPYHWKDWCMVRSRDCLYLWSDAAALELYNESNGWFDFILDSKLATMGPGGSTKGRSARAEFLEELQRAQTQVKTGTPSQPIMSRVSAARLVVGNWAITCKKEGEVQIHNSDDQHQATILKEDLPGFIFKSIIGTKHYFTAETSLGPEFSAGWTGKKNKKFRSETDTLSTKVLQNPEMPRSILENPFVQLIKSNPDVLRQLMTSNPQMRELMELAVVEYDPGMHNLQTTSLHYFEDAKFKDSDMEIEISDDESLPENFPTYDDSELFSHEDYVGHSRKLEPLMPEYVKDEMEALEHFTKVFRDRYGECHPVFYIGPLDNAIRDSCSAKERKLLAIYLHHDGSILSNVFCSQTLCNEGVVNFLTSNFIIWAWDMTLDTNHARLTTLATRHFGSVAATQIRGYSPDNFPVLLIISRSMMTNEVADVIRDVVTVDELMPRLIHDQEVFSEQQRKESTWVEEVLQNTEMRLSIWMNQLIMSYPDELRQRMTSNPQMRECMEMSDIMEDDHRTLSRHLWGILDGIGLCPEERKAVTNRAITREILLTLGNVLAGPKITTYVAGSRYEATTTAGIQSDRDIINVYEDLAVVGDLQHAPQNVLCLWLVTDRSTPAGYTKLQLVENGIPGIVHPTVSFDTPYISVDRLGRVLLNNSWEEYQLTDKEINGPAITYTCKYIIGETVDCVLAFRCASWPDVAREWLTRDRRHNWPTQVQLQELRALGCLFVGVGHCHSTESEQQWRISFTLQERYLMISLNETQYKCYVVMKVINKDFITSQLQDSISSYHFKTVLLYAIESNPAEFWVPGNLVKCILFCLEALYKCAVKGDCPSYFIPEANLFDRRVHGELRKQIVSLLAELLRENGKFLFRINCDNIGIQLSAESTSRAPHIASVLLDTDMLMNHCIRAGYEITLLVTNILYYTHTTSIETLQDQISRLVSTTRVAEHTESETREAVQYILPHLHTRLVSHLAAGIVLRGSGDSTAGNMRTLMEDHIQLAISPGLTSLRLKVATIYYMLEDYNAAERLLTDVAAAIRGPVINVCPCQDPGYKGQRSTHLPDTFEGGKDFVNSHMCYCISFPPSEVAVMPAALQYEMFKSRKTMPRENCLQGKCGLWYAWSNVDAQVFFHYMQYLLYDMLGDVWRRQRALHDMFYVAIDANDHLYHRETAFNLLGWIFKQEGYVNMAARCFLRSILIEPEDNAAKWHIADLYLRQSKASRRAPLALTLPMISY